MENGSSTPMTLRGRGACSWNTLIISTPLSLRLSGVALPSRSTGMSPSNWRRQASAKLAASSSAEGSS